MDSKQRSPHRAGSQPEILPEPWGFVDLPEDGLIHRIIGPMDLWIRRTEGEIRMAWAPLPAPGAERDPPVTAVEDIPPPAAPPGTPSTAEAAPASGALRQPGDEAPADPAPPPEDLHRTEDTPPEKAAWSRWAPGGRVDRILIQPLFPDRPLVLEPEVPFTLLPGAEARVYIRVPLFARVALAGPEDESVLQDIPTVVLSDTWWGDFLEGELSYWLHTTARRIVRPELLEDHLAVCPLHLVNRSGGELRVEKLTLRVATLSLFAGGAATGGLWADTARVHYHGDAEGSRIEMSGRAPEEAKGGRLVSSPRDPVQVGFRARTFARFRVLPGMGGGQ